MVPGLAFNFCFYDTFKGLVASDSLAGAAAPQGCVPASSGAPAAVGGRGGSCGAAGEASASAARRGPAAGQETQGGSAAASAGPGGWLWRALGGGGSSVSSSRGSGGGAQAAQAGGSGGAAGGVGGGVSPAASALCACLSGLCTSTLTFPLDVVRRRLQVYERGHIARLTYGDVVRGLYGEGGLAAFYRGIGPEYAKVLPGMAIAFGAYETLKGVMGV